MTIEYPNTIFSEAEIYELWNKQHEEDPNNYNKFEMRVDRTHLPPQSRFPGIYYAAFKDGKIVGYSGWREEPTFFKMAGVRTAEHMKRQGVGKRLVAMKTEVINSSNKPSMVFLNNSTFSAAWAETWKKLGWVPLSEQSTKDKLREMTGDDEIYLIYQNNEDSTFVYFPSGFNKSWAILTNFENHILRYEGL